MKIKDMLMQLWIRKSLALPAFLLLNFVAFAQGACNPASLPSFQGFNNTTAPACWSTSIVAVQTGSKINFVSTSSHPPTTSPQEGAEMVQYNAYSNAFGAAGSEERLISAPFNTIGIASVDVAFYWRNENSTLYGSGNYLNEGVQVQYSTDGGTNWFNAGSLVPRQDGSLAADAAQWNLKEITLPFGAGNQASILVGFKFHSEYGDNMYLDAVTTKAGAAVLPVKLIGFSGHLNNGKTTLAWETAQEDNSRAFLIEHSLDGVEFNICGSIPAVGNSTFIHSYSFVHLDPKQGKNFYRLKIADLNGQYTYSNIIKIDFAATGFNLNYYPNPLKDELFMNWEENRSPATIWIFNMEGEIVKSIYTPPGTLQASLNMQQLSSGSYILQWHCGDKEQRHILFKQ
jgi:hypothetical protein